MLLLSPVCTAVSCSNASFPHMVRPNRAQWLLRTQHLRSCSHTGGSESCRQAQVSHCVRENSRDVAVETSAVQMSAVADTGAGGRLQSGTMWSSID
jgi:hypothetical protein